MSHGAERLTWSVGPGDSRPVRLALYASESAFVGAAVAVLLALADVDVASSPAVLASATVGAVAAFRAARTWDAVIEQFAAVEADWEGARRWRWVLAGTGLAAFLIADAASLGQPPHLLAAGFLAVAAVFRGLGWFLSSSGRLDPGALVLAYDDRFEADLTRLQCVYRVTFGDTTVLWLSFERDYATEVPVLYVMPTEVADRARHAFEAGIAAGR